MRLHRVCWEEATGPAGLRFPERTPFVGREAERGELRRLLEQAARGQGALVMIGGEPGVGKTRLAEELLLEARQRGMLAWTGHCYEMEGSPPYIPFVEVLETGTRVVSPEALREALGDAAPEVAKIMPEVRRWYARILIDRDGPGDPSTGSGRDRDKARELVTEAVAMYRQIGMPKHIEMAEELLSGL